MAVGEIITNAWMICWPQLNDLVIMGTVAGIPGFVSAFVLGPVLERFQDLTPDSLNTVSGRDWLLVAGVGLPSMLIEFLAVAAIYIAIIQRGERDSFSVLHCYAATLRRVPALLLAALVGLVVPLALALTLIGLPLAIYLLVSWALTSVVVLAEGRDGIAALGRSRRLVKGHWWHTLNVLLTLVFLLMFLPSLVVGLFPNALSQALIGLVLSAFTTPFFAAGQVALYYDLRARKGEFLGPSQLGATESVTPGQGA